jgi:hypothetical protein
MITDADKIPKQPLFVKGCLTFKDSDHILIQDRGYYRCSEQVKGQCGHHEEKIILVKDMEKRFNNLVKRFELPEGEGIRLFDDLLISLVKVWRKGSVRDMHLEREITALSNIIIDDIKKRRPISTRDFLELKRVYFQLHKNMYEDMLFNFMFDPLFTLNAYSKEQDQMTAFIEKAVRIKTSRILQTFALQIRKIYLSNDGLIKNIEFEGWGWYMIQKLKHDIPNYLSDFKEGFITNTKQFDSFDYFNVIDEFARDDYIDAYSYSALSTKYAKEKILKKIFDGFDDLKPKEKIEYIKKLNGVSKQGLFAYFAFMFRI